MADIFDVLSDPTRRDLLGRLLAAGASEESGGSGDGELSVGALVEQTGLSQPTVSKHLKVLRDHGLVRVREEAQHRFYRIDAAPLREAADWIAAFAPARSAPVAADAREALTPLIAWSGAGAGEQLGRAAATTLHQARNVLHTLQDATEQARDRLSSAAEKVKQVLPVNPGE